MHTVSVKIAKQVHKQRKNSKIHLAYLAYRARGTFVNGHGNSKSPQYYCILPEVSKMAYCIYSLKQLLYENNV